MNELIEVRQEENRLIIDARDCIRKGHHPRQDILSLVDGAESGTVCEILVPHRTGPLIAALEGKGLHVAVSEPEPGTFRLRLLKL